MKNIGFQAIATGVKHIKYLIISSPLRYCVGSSEFLAESSEFLAESSEFD
jgi:hypothetical protein